MFFQDYTIKGKKVYMNIKEKLNLSNPQFVVLLIAVALSIYGIVETILHIDAAVPTSKTMFIC